jgi:hypothetical protein
MCHAGEGDGEPIATGVTEPELLAAVIGPDLDSITAQSALKALREECLFLHYDGVRYVFKTTPNVTQLLEQEFDNVKPEEAEARIKEELDKQLAGRPVYDDRQTMRIESQAQFRWCTYRLTSELGTSTPESICTGYSAETRRKDSIVTDWV